jgi:hypothetical protein
VFEISNMAAVNGYVAMSDEVALPFWAWSKETGPRCVALPSDWAYWTSSQSCEPSVSAVCRVSCVPADAPVRYRFVFLTDWSL